MTNEAERPGVRGFFKRLRAKLNQGPAWLTTDISELLPGRKIDAEILDELETRLITADVGVEATSQNSRGSAPARRAQGAQRCRRAAQGAATMPCRKSWRPSSRRS